MAQNIKEYKKLTLKGNEINDKVDFKMKEVIDIDFDENGVTKDNKTYPYSCNFITWIYNNTFGIKVLMKTFLKNDEQANILREKLKLMPNESNIAVIGCGLTGSELIGSLLDYKFNILQLMHYHVL